MRVSCSYKELIEFINKGRRVYYGDSKYAIYYNDLLIDFNPLVIQLIKSKMNYNESQFMELLTESSIFSILERPFVDEEQIGYLVNRSQEIFLSKLPLGIFCINDVPIGVIQHYFKKHSWLYALEEVDHKEMYHLARYILLSLRELEEKKIFHTCLKYSNIYYDGKKPELIDLHGRKIKYGDDCDFSTETYSDYLMFLMALFRRSCDISLTSEFKDILDIENPTFEDCKSVIKRLEKKI